MVRNYEQNIKYITLRKYHKTAFVNFVLFVNCLHRPDILYKDIPNFKLPDSTLLYFFYIVSGYDHKI